MAGGGKPIKNPKKPIKKAVTRGQKAIFRRGLGGPQLTNAPLKKPRKKK